MNWLDTFFTLAYGWAAFWLLLFVAIGMSRRGKNREDYEVIGFRLAVGAVCAMVVVRRVFAWDAVLLVPFLLLFDYSAFANTLSVIRHVSNYGGINDHRSEDPAD